MKQSSLLPYSLKSVHGHAKMHLLPILKYYVHDNGHMPVLVLICSISSSHPYKCDLKTNYNVARQEKPSMSYIKSTSQNRKVLYSGSIDTYKVLPGQHDFCHVLEAVDN